VAYPAWEGLNKNHEAIQTGTTDCHIRSDVVYYMIKECGHKPNIIYQTNHIKADGKDNFPFLINFIRKQLTTEDIIV
jgi:hypothetical protein